MKKVSVVIFNYNGMDFIDNCVKSVIAQSYKDYDLFMLDVLRSANAGQHIGNGIG